VIGGGYGVKGSGEWLKHLHSKQEALGQTPVAQRAGGGGVRGPGDQLKEHHQPNVG
jgi:hypothetical protein